MKTLNCKKQKHMTLSDRLDIQMGLERRQTINTNPY